MKKIIMVILIMVLLAGGLAYSSHPDYEFGYPIVMSGSGNWSRDMRAVDINQNKPENFVEEKILQGVKYISFDQSSRIIFKVDGNFYLVDGYQHGDGHTQTVWYNTLEVHSVKTLR